MCRIERRPPPPPGNPQVQLPLPPPPSSTYFPQFFTPDYLRLASLASQLEGGKNLPVQTPQVQMSQPTFPVMPMSAEFLSQFPFPALALPRSEAANFPATGRPEAVTTPLEQRADERTLATQSRKRTLPQLDDNGSTSGSDNEQPARKEIRQETKPKRKHEATLDGERRVAIEFETLGTLGKMPQTYGKGGLVVPDGVVGKYSAFGQRWMFSITHSGEPVVCDDGAERVCLSWNITNLTSGQSHSVVETPMDALKRDRDGKTLCNRAFREALSMRVKSLEEQLKQVSDPSLAMDIDTQLKTLQTKRFSEGPLFFGLRHAYLQKEMKRLQSAST